MNIKLNLHANQLLYPMILKYGTIDANGADAAAWLSQTDTATWLGGIADPLLGRRTQET